MIFNVYIFREGEVKIIHLHRLCIDSLFSRISNMAAFVDWMHWMSRNRIQ